MQSKISDYDSFYDRSDWKYPSLDAGISRVRLYFRLASQFNHHIGEISVRILDLGCGTGFYTYCLHLAGYSVVGLDSSISAIAKARKRWAPSLEFIHKDARQIDEIKNEFDVFFCRGLSLYNTCDPKDAGELTNYYLSLIRPCGVIMIITSTDLSGTNPGWVNCTYQQLQSLYSEVEGQIDGPFFFDYRFTGLIANLNVHWLINAYLISLSSKAAIGLIAILARRIGYRIPMMFVVSNNKAIQ